MPGSQDLTLHRVCLEFAHLFLHLHEAKTPKGERTDAIMN